MPYLTKLKLIHNPALNPENPAHNKRMRLIEDLIEQQNMLQAMLDKKIYKRYESQIVSNPMTGDLVEKSLPVKLKQWYWCYDGYFYFQCYCQNRKLMIRDDMTVICSNSAKDLINAIGILMCAVEAGELDKNLDAIN